MRQLPLRYKFGFILGGFVLTIVILIGINLHTARTVTHSLHDLRDSSFPRFTDYTLLATRFKEIGRIFEDAAVIGDSVVLERNVELKAEFLALAERLQERSATGHDLSRIVADFETFYVDASLLVSRMNEAELTGNGIAVLDGAEIQELSGRVVVMRKTLARDLALLTLIHKQSLKRALAASLDEMSHQVSQSITIGAIASALLLLLIIILARQIVRPIRTLFHLIREVGKGHLDVEPGFSAQPRDEIGLLARAFVEMTQGLRETTVSRDYVDNILSSMADPLLVMSADARIKTANRAARELLEYADEEMTGLPFRRLLAPAIANPLERNGMELLHRAGFLGPVAVELCTRSERLIPASLNFSLMQAPPGEERSIICVGQDVTDGRETAEQLRRTAQSLEAANEELGRAHDAAVQSSRMKSEFLANMSHEIRTPMNGILGMNSLLLDTDLSEEQQDCAQSIQYSAESLLRIINDILDFSKIEAGRLELDPISLDLRIVVEEVGGMLAARAAEKGLETIVRYQPAAPRQFIGDQGRINQILTNLASNAIKFTPEGHVYIEAYCESWDDSTARMRISVTDTGIGIPPAKLDHIFEKFTQADASTTRRFGGTGLGLAIGKQLVELMGGSIGVTSEVGEGTTFWFALPLQIDADATAKMSRKAQFQGGRALVVHGNPLMQETLVEQLVDWQMSSAVASSAGAAMGALQNAVDCDVPFDLVLIDDELPDMDGRSAVKLIRGQPALKTLPVIMLKRIGDQESEVVAGLPGRVVALVKPVREVALHKALVEFLQPVADTIRLVASPEAEPVPEPAPEPDTDRRIAEHLQQIHVLLAEDNLVNQKVAARHLAKLGCEVDVAGDGREALEKLKSTRYQLVFMDCQMPIMDGYQAVREIRRHEEDKRDGARTPIIALTANAMRGDREKCIDAGMDDYLAKPVQLDDLRLAIERWTGTADSPPADG